MRHLLLLCILWNSGPVNVFSSFLCFLCIQESIRNSADGKLLSAPDSLEVLITESHGSNSDEQPSMANLASTPRKSHPHSFGIDGLDLLKFTYKVYPAVMNSLFCFLILVPERNYSNIYIYCLRQVSWPLELIANMEAIKKYNQVNFSLFAYISKLLVLI